MTEPLDDDEREGWRASYQDAWAALRMIRETVETLGPPARWSRKTS